MNIVYDFARLSDASPTMRNYLPYTNQLLLTDVSLMFMCTNYASRVHNVYYNGDAQSKLLRLIDAKKKKETRPHFCLSTYLPINPIIPHSDAEIAPAGGSPESGKVQSEED
jgi:hypothetical protein